MLKLNGEKQHHLCRYLCLRVSELLRQRYVEPIHYTYKKLKKKKKIPKNITTYFRTVLTEI